MDFKKKGAFNLEGTAMNVVYGFIAVVLILVLGSALLPEVMTSVASIGNITDLPLATLWTNGIVTMIIVVVLLVAVIKGAGKIAK